jgi:archaellum component FlaF (FlaF/FlaG flagellin family)
MRLTVLISATLLSTAIVAHAVLQRYEAIDRANTGVIVRVDRLTGSVVACLPHEEDDGRQLSFRCDGRIP